MAVRYGDPEPYDIEQQKEFTAKQQDDKYLTSWDDMSHAGLPPESVRKAYAIYYGSGLPDEVHINDDFCKREFLLSYNIPQAFIVHKKNPVTLTKIADTRILENDLDEAIQDEVTLSTTVTNSATLTVNQITEFKFSDSGEVVVSPDIFSISDTFSESFTISNSIGSTATQSIATGISDKATITIPPHSKIKVDLEVSWTSIHEDWEMPVEIQGWTGAQFPNRVNGHYYWYSRHEDLFPTRVPIISNMKGTVDVAYNSTGSLKVQPA